MTYKSGVSIKIVAWKIDSFGDSLACAAFKAKVTFKSSMKMTATPHVYRLIYYNGTCTNQNSYQNYLTRRRNNILSKTQHNLC